MVADHFPRLFVWGVFFPLKKITQGLEDVDIIKSNSKGRGNRTMPHERKGREKKTASICKQAIYTRA